MGKYSNLGDKRPRDYWSTVDPDAVKPLIPFVKGKTYAEPCFGSGELYNRLREQDTSIICRWMSDIDSPLVGIMCADALNLKQSHLEHCDCIITNPPFSWNMLQPLMDHFISLKDTWLLLPADNMHNKRFGPYMKCCSKVVSVGRLFWMLDGDKGTKGKENYAWYLFNKTSGLSQTNSPATQADCQLDFQSNRDFVPSGTIFYGR